MKLNDYQEEVKRTSEMGLSTKETLCYLSMGMCGEAGELINQLKKVYYHGHDYRHEEVKEELGDMLWYLTALANCAGLTLEEIAKDNIEKRRERYPNGFDKDASKYRK